VFFPDEPVPLEAVREVAALLQTHGLGKIVLESKEGPRPLRLKFERESFPATLPLPAAPVAESPSDGTEPLEAGDAPVLSARTEIVAPCVGVFRAPKKPVGVGDEVASGQLVGAVESLRVPNEVYAPIEGRVVELSVVGGQGVEWGQTLLVIEPIS